MASIATPSSLATFSYSAQASSSRVPHVTLGPVCGGSSKGKLAVAAVHGDGVWTYDIKTLRPTTSFTVSPSTVFGSAPVSFIPPVEEVEAKPETEGEASEGSSRTATSERVTAVVVQAGEGVKDGRALWVWKGEDGEAKTSVPLDTSAHSVHHLRGRWPLIVVGATGGLAAVGPALDTATTLIKPKPKAARVVAAAVVDSGLAPRAVLVDESGRAHVYSLEVNDGRAELVADALVSNTPVLAADIGPDGVISAIDKTHRVHSRTVRSIVEGAPTDDGVQLAHPTTPAAIVSLPLSSRALAALSVPHPSPSVALVVPSPELPAVLASASISAAASNTITHLAVIARPSEDHVVLGTVLSHPGSDGAGRSVIHVSDVSLPTGGVGLALLIGSAERTAAVFDKVGASSTAQPVEDSMINAVSAALSSGTADGVTRAEKAFTSWLSGKDKVVPEPVARKILDIVFSAALKDGKKTGVYASKIVQTLVDRNVVADSMWPNGVLLDALVPLADWRNVSHMVRTSSSLPARTAVALIAHVLKEDTPTLSSVLEDLLSGPAPDPAYRVALRQQLDGPSALRVFEQLTTWAEEAATAGDGLEAWPETTAAAAPVPLPAVVTHASLLLDAHLPTLMAIPEAEPVLQRLQAALAPALAVQADYRRLRAPVDAALRLAKDNERKERERAAAAVAQAEARGAAAGKMRARVKSAPAGLTEEAVGKYRVEDLVF